MAELEGKKLDRYELRQLVGKGGMANVYQAYDPYFNRLVAVKVFKREDEEMLRRFIREAQVMASLSHPHLVQIYDSGEFPVDGVTRYYIVMPFLTGGTLRVRIRYAPLTLPEACQALSEIGSALDYIHSRGIIHRDIKSSNVLLDDAGHCYLTDFGIARVTTDATQLTSTGNVLGTVDYVAPELFEISRRADARSDLYSLGILLYETVTGRLPFSAENQVVLVSMHVNKKPPSPRSLVPHMSAQVERVMLKALEKRPEQRYTSATELANAFCRAVNKSGAAVVERVPAAADVNATALAPVAEGLNYPSPVAQVQIPVAPPPLNTPIVRPSPLATGTEAFVRPAPSPEYVPPQPPPPRITPPPPSRRRSSSRALFLVILACLALIIIAVPSGYALLNRPNGANAPTPTTSTGNTATQGGQTATSSASNSPTPNLTATSQAAAAATATAHAHATATAFAAPTVTAIAHATATAGVIQTATAGQPVYQDSLKNGDSHEAGWDQTSQCVFAADGYRVKQSASFPYFRGCREQNNVYTNLALTVDATLISGHSGGVFVRLNTNLFGNYDGYLFEFDSQGNYKVSSESGSTVTPLQDWGPSSNLNKGYNVTNTLQIMARGGTLFFYINGAFQVSVNDNSYTNGNVGFLATSVNNGANTVVVYNNLKIYALS